MPTYVLPLANSTNQSWTQGVGAGNNDTNFWDELDEGFGPGRGSGVGPDDAITYWESPVTPTGNILETVLPVVSDPGFDTGHILRTRNRKNATGSMQLDVTISLMQVLTVIATRTFTNISGSAWTTRVINLTAAEAALITDYGSLRVRTFVTRVGTGTGRRGRESAHELELPLPPDPFIVKSPEPVIPIDQTLEQIGEKHVDPVIAPPPEASRIPEISQQTFPIVELENPLDSGERRVEVISVPPPEDILAEFGVELTTDLDESVDY